MIIGAHSIIYSKNAEADRALLRDVLKLPHVDVGDGWLIFGLPPAEVAVHPGDENDVHEFYLMCDDLEAFVAEMADRGIQCDPVDHQPWGLLTRMRLPGGGRLGIYEPRHPRPPSMKVAKTQSRPRSSKPLPPRKRISTATVRERARTARRGPQKPITQKSRKQKRRNK